ncbi:UDP-N-acetylmuramoyl-L-alanine--D-glutamate ligase [Halarcobacter bivalviorum]|uniref:UDP-N-acetylmuramoyl-L-alanine--D-glutamate ligase n=1 Tax=Halarcobacter bivalviorum TaxID=663364 RepID=A0AAX2A7C2_9BACT|nr:UDP-N-acetylmuramoyl-L-alanine--D-glutamate ligase [Halarcobacter bivalviorum]AXH11391.1 UDP-N-acetylmuramoyl-L-alanine:D-glutamate ligase [Halarcobacter bivalviorum]RXK09421.1 UDP-N-acetylmuramoyl-L-alanine--D-glutamate ligase [Halarcobacter bivalviorum]
MIRVLGKGLTAQAIKEEFEDVILYDDSDFNQYDKQSEDITVVSPGIPPFNEMVLNSNNIISDYDLLYNEMPFSIWISGTNGKTTTTQMCQHILKDKGSLCGGNIGTPISKLNKDSKIWILETSSFTFHYTQHAKPNLYLLLPISDDHVSWHGNFQEYEKAKLKPLSMMEEGEIAIIPEKYKDIKTLCHLITYKDSDDLCEKFNIDKTKVNFKEPFLLDALLALAAKKIIFDEVDYININTYKVDEHKVEEFKDKKNRVWIDDSKATNVDATINALVPYIEKKIHLILGGDDKGANLIPLFEYLKDLNVEIYTIGSNFERLNELSKKFSLNFHECKTLNIAVEKISQKLDSKGVGMLSPAAASLDQFSSYKQRGKEFKKLVYDLSLL